MQRLSEVNSEATRRIMQMEGAERVIAVDGFSPLSGQAENVGFLIAGLVGFYNVLDAQGALFQIEDQLNQSKGEAGVNLTRVYKAIGGGWQGVE